MFSKLIHELVRPRRGSRADKAAIAQVALGEGRWEAAFAHAEALIGAGDGRAELRHLAARARLEHARARQHAALRARTPMPEVRGDYDAAAAHFEAQSRFPGWECVGRRHAAAVRREAGDLDGAHRTLADAPTSCITDVEFLLELALDAQCLGDIKLAMERYAAACALHPSDARARAAHALCLVGAGEFARGWEEYERRLLLPEFRTRIAPDGPRWQGEPISGKHLFVTAEQGLGDQIMFASCLDDLCSRGARLTVEVSPRLCELFADSYPEVQVVPKSERRGAARDSGADFWIEAGSLPAFLRRDWSEFPGHAGYLHVREEIRSRWRARLDQLGEGPWVGLAWTGGLPGTLRALRSLPPRLLAPLLQRPGLRYVSLEFADCSADIAWFAAQGIRVEWWPEATFDMRECAGLIAALDDVATVATTVAHLAGAIGKPALVMVPTAGTWRYMWRGDRIPWYPALEVARQQHPADWTAPLERLRRRWAALVGAPCG